MRCSANEVVTLATKAARGAGAPPEQAAAFGTAALSHLAAGCTADDLFRALKALPHGPILELPVLISRQRETENTEVVKFEIKQQDFASLTLSYLYAQPFAVKAKTQGQVINAALLISQPRKQPPMLRVDIPDNLYALMQTFAAKTLVPESAASRLSGAGAGLTDND